MKTKTAPRRRSSNRACVVCSEPVNELAPCPSCSGPYHASCAPRAANCGALGCPAGSSAQEAGAPPSRGQVCPYCRDVFGVEPALICGGCNTRYHQDCAEDLGRCGTLGCRQKLEVRRRSGRAKVTHVRDAPVHPCTSCRRGVPADQASTCMRCAAPYHLECAAHAGRCPCGNLLGALQGPWPLQLLGACALWSLGATLVVFTTWPVIHQLSTRALLLAGAYGPLAAGAAIYAYATRGRSRGPVVVNLPHLLGSLAFLVASLGLGLWVATQKPSRMEIYGGLGVLVAFLLALRVFVHPEIGSSWQSALWHRDRHHR